MWEIPKTCFTVIITAEFGSSEILVITFYPRVVISRGRTVMMCCYVNDVLACGISLITDSHHTNEDRFLCARDIFLIDPRIKTTACIFINYFYNGQCGAKVFLLMRRRFLLRNLYLLLIYRLLLNLS